MGSRGAHGEKKRTEAGLSVAKPSSHSWCWLRVRFTAIAVGRTRPRHSPSPDAHTFSDHIISQDVRLNQRFSFLHCFFITTATMSVLMQIFHLEASKLANFDKTKLTVFLLSLVLPLTSASHSIKTEKTAKTNKQPQFNLSKHSCLCRRV